MDYTGKPFGPMPALMATAEYVTTVSYTHLDVYKRQILCNAEVIVRFAQR